MPEPTNEEVAEVAAEVPVEEVAAEEKPKLKPCCVCPETKQARDACIVEKGAEECGDLIEAHKECMRKLGFNV